MTTQALTQTLSAMIIDALDRDAPELYERLIEPFIESHLEHPDERHKMSERERDFIADALSQAGWHRKQGASESEWSTAMVPWSSSGIIDEIEILDLWSTAPTIAVGTETVLEYAEATLYEWYLDLAALWWPYLDEQENELAKMLEEVKR